MKSNFVQFELWRDCNVGCKFCFNRGLIKSDKISNMLKTIDILKSGEISKFNEIGIIGGEFFGGQIENEQQSQIFYTMMEEISKLMKGGFHKFYFTTSLIYENTSHLRRFLDFLRKHDISKESVLCTSYDTIHRFRGQKELDLWDNNMNMMRNEYPEIRTHVEMIVTQDMIDKTMDGRFSLMEFVEKYKTSVDFLEPNTGNSYKTKQDFDKDVPGFLPTRRSFLDFVNTMCIQKGTIDINLFLNRKIRSDAVYLFYGDKIVLIENRKEIFDRMQSLGEIIDRKFGYIDSEEDMESDVNMIREGI